MGFARHFASQMERVSEEGSRSEAKSIFVKKAQGPWNQLTMMRCEFFGANLRRRKCLRKRLPVSIRHDVNGVLKNSRQSATACFRGMIPLLCAHPSIKRADETRTGD